MKSFCLALIGATMLMSGMAIAQQAPGGPQPALGAPVPTARIIMLKIYVSDLALAEKFYHEVFGATVAQNMGDRLRIMNFPGGVSPGLMIFQSPKEGLKTVGFLLQVPDLEAALASAAANGGKVMTTRFSQDIQKMPAQSRHLFDPDGNDIEVLQIGKPK